MAMGKVVTQKQIDEIMKLKDEGLLSFEDIGKQLNLAANTVSRFYLAEQAKKKKATEEVEKADLTTAEKREKSYKLLETNKVVAFDPSALAAIEQFKKKGIFNDIDESVNKSLEMMSAQTNNPKYVDFLKQGGAIQMQEGEPNPEKEIKKMQVTDLLEAQVNKKKAEAEALVNQVKEGKAQPNSFLPLLQEQLAMKQMQRIMKDINKEDGATDSNPLKEMKEMMMMQVYGNMMQPHKGNGESLELQRKLEELQAKMDKQDTLSEIKKIAESSQGKGMSVEDYIKLHNDKLVAIETQKVETAKANQTAQEEKEKRIEGERKQQLDATNTKIAELRGRLDIAKKEGSPLDDIKKIKDQIASFKEISKEFGEGKETEKSKAELAIGLVSDLATRLKDPLNNVTKGFADKHATEKLKATPVYINPGMNTQPEADPQPPAETTAPVGSSPGPGPEVAPVSQSAVDSLNAPLPSGPSVPPAPETSEDQIVSTFAGQNTIKGSQAK